MAARAGMLCAVVVLPTNLVALCAAPVGLDAGSEKIDRVLDIAPVWAGHPVGFCLLTHGRHQFAAFYNAERQMTVASRTLDSEQWRFTLLPERVGWDSHNSVTMAADDDGFLHLSGNMHVSPLVYFRTRQPLAPDTFERIPHMVGEREGRCTYPVFFRGPTGALLFTYRDGSSGNGNQIWNVYDRTTRAWRRLLDQPLTDGQGERNAYFYGPKRGPDGFFHLCWVWRESPDCATNHDPSYARSKDLIHWENGAGKPLALPITLANSDVVDPVPIGGGIINGNVVLGFDTQKRPIVSYHKFDEAGRTQLYNARLENGRWRVYQTSRWDYRWEFHGGGSIPFEIRVGPVQVDSSGRLTQSYTHPKEGSGAWFLDEETLQPIGSVPAKPDPLAPLRRVESSFPGMQVRWASDLGQSDEPGVRYLLRWETLGPNRDRPRPEPLPAPSMLRLVRLVTLHP